MTPQAQATAHAILDAALAEDPRLMRHHIDDLTPTEQQTVLRALKTAYAMTDSCRWRQPMPPGVQGIHIGAPVGAGGRR